MMGSAKESCEEREQEGRVRAKEGIKTERKIFRKEGSVLGGLISLGSLDPFPQVTLSALLMPPAGSGSQTGRFSTTLPVRQQAAWGGHSCVHVCQGGGGHRGMRDGDTHLV